MANTNILDGPSLEVARSMTIDAIPEKLRCANCNELAINAWKLPCCDSTICSDCHENFTGTECPVCTHTPIYMETCTIAKQLRTTVKVFIKTEARKRGIDLKTGGAIAPASGTPVVETTEKTGAPAGEKADTTPAAVNGHAEISETPKVEPTPVPNAVEAAPEVETTAEQSFPTGEDPTEPQPTENKEQEEEDEDEDDEDDVIITTERPEPEPHKQEEHDETHQYTGQDGIMAETSEHNPQMDQQQQGFGGFDPMFNNNNMANMNMNMNGFNPMMGMPGFPMGMANMMGMPGMMDPSMMFNGGNFGGGMDMSSMMGMAGMGMGGGMGGGMGNMGDFSGMGGPGFFPNQGNYHMNQNFGNAHRQNFHNDRGYGRGYGRGFGRGARGNFGRGRGGWAHQQQQHQPHQYGQNQQFSPQNQVGGPQQSGANSTDVTSHGHGRASPKYELGPDAGAKSGDKAASSHTAGGDQDETSPETNKAGDDTNAAGDPAAEAMQGDGDVSSGQNTQADHNGVGAEQAAVNGEVNGEMQAGEGTANAGGQGMGFEGGMQYDDGFGNRGGGYRGRGGYGYGGRANDSTDFAPAPAPPINAPTGPKAMRQGLPNTGWASRAVSSQQKPTPTPAPENKASGEQGFDEYKDRSERGRTRSRSARRHSTYDKDHDRDDGYESEESRARRKDRERRKRKEREERYQEERAADRDDGKHRKSKYRSRSASPTDDSSSRRRHRDRDEEHRSSRSHRDRSKDRHRRRHRSKSPAKDDAEDDHGRRKSKSDHDDHKESRRSRKHSRREDDEYHEKDRKDRSHRSSKHERSSREDREPEREQPRAVIEPPSDELGFKIKGSKSARATKDAMAPPTSRGGHERGENVQEEGSSGDPYAEERARAQQDREAREAQRRNTSLGKRNRGGEEEIDAPRGPKGDRTRPVKKGRKERRINYKYEDEVEGDAMSRWR